MHDAGRPQSSQAGLGLPQVVGGDQTSHVSGMGQRLSKSVVWIGGAQWAGKTSVARILSARHGLQLYQYDYNDSRGHAVRAAARPDLYPHMNLLLRRPADARWVQRTPEEMAADDLRAFDEPFRMTLEDLSALPASPTVLAEGWGLRPGLVAPLLDSPRRAIFLLPSDRFRERQVGRLPKGRPGVHPYERPGTRPAQPPRP